VVVHVLPLVKLVTATLMLAPVLWIATSLSGVVGARALQLVAVAVKLVAVPLLHLLFTADNLALLHWRNKKFATLLIAQDQNIKIEQANRVLALRAKNN